MTANELPQDLSDPATAVQLASKAPILLAQSSSIPTSFPSSVLKSPESPETWTKLAELFYACLITGDDKSAHLCLERLTQRFGAENERIMAMRGLYQEAVATDDATLSKILQDYNKLLVENPMNVPVHKRRIGLVRSMGRTQEAISTLVDFLDTFPSDVESWCELSDLYESQGLYSQAIFCIEEALLSTPYAWNLHSRLGELEFLNSQATNEGAEVVRNSLVQAIQRYSRSIELCDDYLRGYYGLKIATAKYLDTSSSKAPPDAMTHEKAKKLNDIATAKLQKLIKARTSQKGPESKQSELIAAQALLSR